MVDPIGNIWLVFLYNAGIGNRVRRGFETELDKRIFPLTIEPIDEPLGRRKIPSPQRLHDTFFQAWTHSTPPGSGVTNSVFAVLRCDYDTVPQPLDRAWGSGILVHGPHQKWPGCLPLVFGEERRQNLESKNKENEYRDQSLGLAHKEAFMSENDHGDCRCSRGSRRLQENGQAVSDPTGGSAQILTWTQAPDQPVTPGRLSAEVLQHPLGGVVPAHAVHARARVGVAGA